MDYKEIIKNVEPEFQKVLSFLEKEMAKIRTGKASPALVEDVVVDCFGQKFPLKQLASISTPEPRTILIQPWDKSYIEGIEKGIAISGLGVSAVPDKDRIRINLPPLSDEYRKTLLHVLSEKQEEARKTIRHYREEAWKELQDKFKEKEISEDEKFRGKDELQEKVDAVHEKIEQMGEKKKNEIME